MTWSLLCEPRVLVFSVLVCARHVYIATRDAWADLLLDLTDAEVKLSSKMMHVGRRFAIIAFCGASKCVPGVHPVRYSRCADPFSPVLRWMTGIRILERGMHLEALRWILRTERAGIAENTHLW